MTAGERRVTRLERVINYDDARALARRKLPRALFDYVDGGANDEVTLERNRTAFRDVALTPRVAQWVQPDLRATVVGQEIDLPVLVAPCGGMRVVHPEGDVGAAKAAAGAGTIHISSSAAGYSLEEIAQATNAPKWFQLYTMGSRTMMESLVDRAGAAGYTALVVTADTAVNGNRERDVRNGFSLAVSVNARTAFRMSPQLVRRPGWTSRFVRAGMPYTLANTATDGAKAQSLSEMARTGPSSQSPTWDDIAWIREHWHGPMLVKGLVTAEDAKRAVDAGANGVIVSNHGGRQLDGAPATMTALPSIAEAVGSEIDVLLDSGVRRGTDVLKAVAMGAKAVLIGRMAMYGLAIGGSDGVTRMLEILRADMYKSMQLMACPSIKELDHSWLASS